MSVMAAETHSIATRPSLIGRLSNWEDHASWDEFHKIYHNLVFGLARRSGLTESESEEVAQDVFKRVAETIQDFDCDPSRGTFKGWLMNLTRWRIGDKFRARPPETSLDPYPDRTATDIAAGIEELSVLPDDWETEWQHHVLALALKAVARRTDPKHFQVFDLHHRQGWSVLRIARELGMNPATIYVVNHRLKGLLCAEAERVKSRLG